MHARNANHAFSLVDRQAQHIREIGLRIRCGWHETPPLAKPMSISADIFYDFIAWTPWNVSPISPFAAVTAHSALPS